MKATLEAFAELQNNLKTLRSEKGCPWDRAQTFKSLAPLFLEEAYELCEHLEKNESSKALAEELGDILLHVVFIAEIAEEQNTFSLLETIENLNQKIINRHPHVFADSQVSSIEEIKQNWEIVKEKKEKKAPFSGIPKALPALKKAQKIQVSASRQGLQHFDTAECITNLMALLKKLKDNFSRLENTTLEYQLGQLFTIMVQLVQSFDKDAETLCQAANASEKTRFLQAIEKAKAENIDLNNASASDLENLWLSIEST